MVTLSVASREKQLSRSKHKLNAAIFVLDKKKYFYRSYQCDQTTFIRKFLLDRDLAENLNF